nr:YchJ family metal-binding protein [Verrucomicrobiota bacterium JB025]
MNEGSENKLRTRQESLCPCKSRASYATCCMPYHYGKAKPETAEQLMRSRYSAYFFGLIDYLADTTHPDVREPDLKRLIEESMRSVSWSFLTVLGTSKGGKRDKVGKVEFVAEYYVGNERREMHECSRFRRYKGDWKYLDGKG